MAKTVIIHTAKKAIRDFNKKAMEFAEIQGRMQRQSDKKALPAMPIEPGLDHHVVSLGLPAHFSVKSALAKQIGIHNYTGTKEQDALIMASSMSRSEREGNKKLEENENKKSEAEQKNKDREYALKEKELEIKQNIALPNSDDIAGAIIKKYQE